MLKLSRQGGQGRPFDVNPGPDLVKERDSLSPACRAPGPDLDYWPASL